MTPPDGELMTGPQVAAYCQVTPDTVRRWRRTGELPETRRTGKGWMYARADVEALLERVAAAARLARARAADERPMIVRAQVEALLARRRVGG